MSGRYSQSAVPAPGESGPRRAPAISDAVQAIELVTRSKGTRQNGGSDKKRGRPAVCNLQTSRIPVPLRENTSLKKHRRLDLRSGGTSRAHILRRYRVFGGHKRNDMFGICRRSESNRHGIEVPPDFESGASTSFTTPANARLHQPGGPRLTLPPGHCQPISRRHQFRLRRIGGGNRMSIKSVLRHTRGCPVGETEEKYGPGGAG